jgi:anti-sigma B factor antagonist
VQPGLEVFGLGYAGLVPRERHSTGSGTPPPPATTEGNQPSVQGHDRIAEFPVLEVSGELDLAVAPWLSDQVDALFVGGASSVILDLSSATFLDSTALGVLVGVVNRCRDLGGRVHLVVTEPQILRVLTITGLSGAFVIHASRADLRDASADSSNLEDGRAAS